MPKNWTLGFALAVALAVALAWGGPRSAYSQTFGDANCDGHINSVDAALVLQFDAGLTFALSCQEKGDANGDGFVNSLDAALILQFDAALIDTLGPPASSPVPIQTEPLAATGTPTIPLFSPAPTLPLPPPTLGAGVFVSYFPFLFLGNPGYNCQFNETFTFAYCNKLHSATYSCSAVVSKSGATVLCTTFSVGFPSYSCSIGVLVDCRPFEPGFPSYSWLLGGDQLDCTTFQLGWASYSCRLEGDSASCSTFSFDFPNFSCTLVVAKFSCG